LHQQARCPRDPRDAGGGRDGAGRGQRCRPGAVRHARHRYGDRHQPRGRRESRDRQPRRDGAAAAAARVRVAGLRVRCGPSAGLGAPEAHQGPGRAEGEAVSTRARAKKAPKQRELRPQRPPMRGWLGRGRGQSNYVQQADEWRGTTVQVCGMWPFAIGAGTPMVGVPFGRHLLTGATLGCDPISWYQRANLIGNPSVFFLGRPGLGKTSAVMRMAVGLSGQGVIPLVLGDTRPDYVRMVEKLGGQVIPLGRNRGSLNVLDPGEAPDAARRLRAAGYRQAAEEVLADAQGLRLNMLVALITVLRKSAPTAREETILARGIAWLDEHHDGVPLIPDLLRVIRSAPPELREAALDRGTDQRYQEVTEELEASLVALSPGGKFGDVFAKPTTRPMRRDRAVVYDVSAIPQSDGDLRAVALLASWSAGFAVVNIAQTLADVGLENRRHYFVILDELHQALKAGPGLVDRVDYLTRLNRT